MEEVSGQRFNNILSRPQPRLILLLKILKIAVFADVNALKSRGRSV